MVLSKQILSCVQHFAKCRRKALNSIDLIDTTKQNSIQNAIVRPYRAQQYRKLVLLTIATQSKMRVLVMLWLARLCRFNSAITVAELKLCTRWQLLLRRLAVAGAVHSAGRAGHRGAPLFYALGLYGWASRAAGSVAIEIYGNLPQRLA